MSYIIKKFDPKESIDEYLVDFDVSGLTCWSEDKKDAFVFKTSLGAKRILEKIRNNDMFGERCYYFIEELE